MPEANTVRLGDHLLPVVPQRHARLRNLLSSSDLENIASANYAGESYRILCIFIPQLAATPLWEWEGYGSQELMDKAEYKEELDKSPTTLEIIAAFESALKTSGADRLGKLLELVSSTTAIAGTQTQN